MKRSTSMTSPPTATRRCLEPAPMDSSLRLETEERVAEAVARAGAPRSFTVCLWSDGFTVRAEGLPAAPPVARGNVVGLADLAEPAGPLQSYGDHLPFLRAIRDGEVPPQFLPGGDVVRLDVEDYLPCSYAQCRHLLDAAPAHVAPRLPAAELRAKRLARFAT
ncbi:succinate transmembrane transporter [Aureococcus anophagefferens]|nr:succinate transmembrane transporter [Aureococcus anophagefferens]